jgi:hypothetical protein
MSMWPWQDGGLQSQMYQLLLPILPTPVDLKPLTQSLRCKRVSRVSCKEKSFDPKQFGYMNVHYALQHKRELHNPDIQVLWKRLTVGKGPIDQG